MPCPTVAKVVAVNGSHYYMLKAERRHCPRYILRLRRIERTRHPRLYVAEGAGARAGVAHDHHRGVLLFPALSDAGAASLSANRVKLVLAKYLGSVRIASRAGSLH